MNLFEALYHYFIASFCTLVIEKVCGRILAPFVGVSIYTWTRIIALSLPALVLELTSAASSTISSL
jgi:hypothetical protein